MAKPKDYEFETLTGHVIGPEKPKHEGQVLKLSILVSFNFPIA